MVKKRKLGPQVEAKERKPGSGRKARPLSQHPQRYIIAWLDVAAMLSFEGREGAKALLGHAIGKPHETRPDVMTMETSLEAFNREADRWRKMAERYVSPADLEWRRAISEAIMLAVTIGHAAEPGILGRADAVGEIEWARSFLLPPKAPRVSVREHAQMLSKIFLSQLADNSCCSD